MGHRSIAAATVLLACCSTTLAQTFPSRPIRIVVPAIAGSSPDVRVRQIAPKMSEAMAQPVIVDNRPGANGMIATQLAAKSPADGHTVLYALINNAINDALTPNSCCRLNMELIPIVHFTVTPLIMVINPSVPAQTLREYIQLAKAKPRALTYGSAGPGSITHLLGEWIKVKSAIQVLDVPYKSVGAELPDLVGGQISTAYLSPVVVTSYIQSGKLRALAVTTKARLGTLAEIPTLAEAGLPEVETSVWNGFFVPAGTPATTIRTLNREFLRAFNAADVREQVAASGSAIVGGTPEEFSGFIRSEVTKWARVVKEAGLKPQ